MKKFKSVNDYFDSLEQWQREMRRLREIVSAVGLRETLKWSMPVYVAENGKNVVGIFCAKAYFGIWFYQGALLKDAGQVLTNAQEGKTKALRQWRFLNLKDLKVRQIKKYILEATQLAEAGVEIKPIRNKPLNIPSLLQVRLSKDSQLHSAFDDLSLSRRREYADYISDAKKDETKLRRIEKIVPMILEAKGLNDRYR
jgi:uncharacterized protein YdeI (YjbR/CyaY-like superfamily)